MIFKQGSFDNSLIIKKIGRLAAGDRQNHNPDIAKIFNFQPKL